MPKKQIRGFKGYAQHVDQEQLSPEYATVCENLNVDEPVGQLSMRAGFAKWNAQALTSPLSIYEYTIEEDSGAVITIVNDNDEFKYFKNGAYVGALTRPTVGGVQSTVSRANHDCYFGWRNAIRIATGTAETDHVLWFGYCKRDTADNDGLFGNTVDENGSYKFMRSQLIADRGAGNFAQVRKIVKAGDNYFAVHHAGKWVYKFDSTYNLKQILNPLSETAQHEDNDYLSESIPAITTDGTDVFVAYTLDTGESYVVKRDADTWEEHDVSGTFVSKPITDIAANANSLYVVAAGRLYDMDITDLTTENSNTTTGMADCYAVEADASNVYTGNARTVQVRDIGDIATVDNTSANLGDAGYYVRNILIEGSNVYATLVYPVSTSTMELGGIGTSDQSYHHNIYDLDSTTLATNSTISNVGVEMSALLWDSAKLLCLSQRYGTLHSVASPEATYPNLLSIGITRNGSPGATYDRTFFYKVSMIDIEGQESVLTEAARFSATSASGQANIFLGCKKDDQDYFLRVKKLRLYRAYASIDDASEPETEYKFLYEADINFPSAEAPSGMDVETGWLLDSTSEMYYLKLSDKVSEDDISSTTYEENSGISDNTKPRYVNGCYFKMLNDQLYLARLWSDDELLTSQIVRSPINSPDVMPLYDVFNFQEGNGLAILGVSSLYNRLVVFKQYSGGIFNDTRLEDELNIGLANEGAHVKHNSVIYFGSDKGIYALENNIPVLISDPVRTLYTGGAGSKILGFADDLERLIVGIYGSYTLIYSLRTKTWVKYTWNEIRDIYKNTSGDYIALDDDNVQKLFSGTDDDGTAIDVHYASPIINFEEFGVDNEFYELGIKVQSILTGAGTNQITVSDNDGTNLNTTTLTASGSTNPVMMNLFMGDVWAESFQAAIQAQVTSFKLSGIIYKYNRLGDTVNEI